MKEDITQPSTQRGIFLPSCGLVMKEDITQHTLQENLVVKVVVW